MWLPHSAFITQTLQPMHSRISPYRPSSIFVGRKGSEIDGRRPQRLHAHPHRDRALVADRLADELERLEPEASPGLEAAAVLVRPLVVEGREELERQVAVAAVDVDDVEAGVARRPGRAHPVALDAADVRPLHRLGDDEVVVVARQLRGRHRRHSRLEGARMCTPVRELDAGERVEAVRLVAHEREVPEVVVVPEAGRDDGPEVRVDTHESLLGADRRPAALGLHAAEPRLGARLLAPEAGAMRHLVEAVPERLRPDADGLEEGVVARIAWDRGDRIAPVAQAVKARTGGHLVAESLEALGAEVCVGVPGVHPPAIWEGLRATEVRAVGFRTELNAGFAADGYARG